MRKFYLLIAAIALIHAAEAAAVDFGLHVDYNKFENANEGNWGVGGRLDVGDNLRVIIPFDYYFVDAGDLFDEGDFTEEDLDLRFWELNANLVYQFDTDAAVYPYFGAGVGIARRTFDDVEDIFDDERTEVGFNALGGIKFGVGVQPFIEVRGTWYGDDDEVGEPDLDFGDAVSFRDRFVVSGGVLF